MKVKVGEKEFGSKTALSKYIIKTKNDIGLCSSLKNNHYEFYLFMIELFYRHPNSDIKMENMIDISIEKNVYKHLAFYIQKSDGTNMDIGIKTCVDGKGMTNLAKFKASCRTCIEPQIENFRIKKLNMNICRLCNKKIIKAHIDHKEPSFQNIFKNFIDDNSFEIPSIYDDEILTEKCKFRTEEKVIEQAFQIYHKEIAVLEKICAKCNLSKGKN